MTNQFNKYHNKGGMTNTRRSQRPNVKVTALDKEPTKSSKAWTEATKAAKATKSDKFTAQAKGFAPKPMHGGPVKPNQNRNPKAGRFVTPLTTDIGVKMQKSNNPFIEGLWDMMGMNNAFDVSSGSLSSNVMESMWKYTTNGSLQFSTTGSSLLDMNYRISSYRNASPAEIAQDFKKTFNENPVLAMRWLFFVRDCRGGAGEKRLFKECMKALTEQNCEWLATVMVPIIPQFGSYKDWFFFWDNKAMRSAILKEIVNVLTQDVKNYTNDQPVTLLAKYLPSNNSSSKESRKMALQIASYIGWSERAYRQTLSALREYIDVVERKMSAQEWQAINYEHVPSKANLIYKNAFMRHDGERRQAYLDALSKGEAKINGSVNMPHEVLLKYRLEGCGYDDTYEALWKALPDYGLEDDILVISDGSGSMTQLVDHKAGPNSVRAMDVQQALSIYFSEHNTGAFKDMCMTFGNKPHWVDFRDCHNLRDKLRKIAQNTDCSNTNLEAVFNLILSVAKNQRLTQEQLPSALLIITDGQFDSMCDFGDAWGSRPTKSDFEMMAQKYANAGYQLPKLIFWNVCTNTSNVTVPVTMNDRGVTLISGFTPALVKMVLTGQLNPYKALVETISDPRYDIVTETMAKGLKEYRENQIKAQARVNKAPQKKSYNPSSKPQNRGYKPSRTPRYTNSRGDYRRG